MAIAHIDVFAGHDNDQAFLVTTDGVPVNLLAMDRVGIEIDGAATKSVDSVTHAALFDLATNGANGEFSVRLGGQFAESDTEHPFTGRLVLFDAGHPNGVRHDAPFTIVVRR